MQIRISVVIPTYRRPELLVRCLTALSEQYIGHSDFEVIVVSDGLDAYTEQVLKHWISRRQLNLIYLHTDGKKGPAAARNMGWQHARADLIAFTDDDCIPDRNWLQAFVNAFDRRDDAACTGQTVVPLPQNPSDFANNTAQLQHAEFITANCACTKQVLQQVGGFDEHFKLAWREDSDLQFKLLLNNIPILSCQNALVTHPIRYAPWGISIKEQKKSVYDALLFKKYPQLYRKKISRYPNWNYYLTIILWPALIICIALSSAAGILVTAALLAGSIAYFVYKRLKNTDKSISHVTEMLITSLCIPFLSIYWRVYGAIKFRVFFI
jgi:GT2 family glycosyltransferase